MKLAIRTLGLAATLTVAAPVMVCAQPQLKVEGTEFVLIMAGGSVLRSADLVGATLRLRAGGEDIDVTIKSVEVDLCDPDADGRSLGFPIPNGRGGFDLTCTSGAVGKCVRWGYRPWEDRPGGPPLQALHQACVHMARADYGGDGHGATRDGTLIFFCDRFGIHACGQGARMAFEAGWGTGGATCVARPRIPENISLEQLAERYPRLKPRLGRAACTEASAQDDPTALLFNRSQE